MAKAKSPYIMDYISDKDTYKAVMFACQMIREGTSPSIAIRKAAYYYETDIEDVAYYVGQRGGRKRKERR